MAWAASGRRRGVIDLFSGWPNPGLLSPDRLSVASAAVLSDQLVSIPALCYGPDEGSQPLRKEIARWLTGFYQPQEAISPERICISGGASQNLACLLQTFTDPVYTRSIWIVAPTYHLACRIFEDAGFVGKLHGVPEDAEGVDLAFLSEQLRQSEARAQAEDNSAPVCFPSGQAVPGRVCFGCLSTAPANSHLHNRNSKRHGHGDESTNTLSMRCRHFPIHLAES